MFCAETAPFQIVFISIIFIIFYMTYIVLCNLINTYTVLRDITLKKYISCCFLCFQCKIIEHYITLKWNAFYLNEYFYVSLKRLVVG